MLFKNLIKFISGKYRLIIIRGESMSPTLKNNQIVWVDYDKDSLKNLKKGDIALFRNPFGDNLIVKRVNHYNQEKGYWMKGDNNRIMESSDSELFGYVKHDLLRGRICNKK